MKKKQDQERISNFAEFNLVMNKNIWTKRNGEGDKNKSNVDKEKNG